MSEPFLAEIRMVGFNFAPQGWAFCDGQVLPINQNQALFSLLGTTYGGDGQTNFALPDLRGRTPIHRNGGHPVGQRAGEETHTLDGEAMPQHQHTLQASADSGNAPIPQDSVLAAANNLYRSPDNPTGLRAGSISSTGGGQAHENMQPFLTVNFCIALQGLFPSPN